MFLQKAKARNVNATVEEMKRLTDRLILTEGGSNHIKCYFEDPTVFQVPMPQVYFLCSQF